MDFSVEVIFGPLARLLCNRPLVVGIADEGRRAHTDGRSLLLSAASSESDRRLELIVQCALLTLGSLAPDVVRQLLGKADRTRRYLVLEVNRMTKTAEAPWALLPWSQLSIPETVDSRSAVESLELSRDPSLPRAEDPRLGEVRPSKILVSGGGWHRNRPNHGRIEPLPRSVEIDPEVSDDGDGQDLPALFRLFNTGLNISSPVAELFRKLLGARSAGRSDEQAGAEIPTRGVRAGTGAPRGSPTERIRFTSDRGDERASMPNSRWVYPEWDALRRRMRPRWCTVHELPVFARPDLTGQSGPPRDVALERGISQLGRLRRPRRREQHGDDFDLDAVIDTVADHLVAQHDHRPRGADGRPVYIAARGRQPDLSALILVDISGSSADLTGVTGTTSHSVLREQATTATALGQALHNVGNRVAVTAFHSEGRDACRALVLRRFADTSTTPTWRAISALRPSRYSRLGAGIRHGCARLLADAGTSHKLLVILSDGVPYDAGYAGRYAAEDVAHALDECAANVVGVLWVCHGEMDQALRNRWNDRPLVLETSSGYHQLRRKLPQLLYRAVNLVMPSIRESALV